MSGVACTQLFSRFSDALEPSRPAFIQLGDDCVAQKVVAHLKAPLFNQFFEHIKRWLLNQIKVKKGSLCIHNRIRGVAVKLVSL